MNSFSIPSLTTLQMEEMRDEANRVKMCFAFAKSPLFFNQELAVLNPNPVRYRVGYVAPLDCYSFVYRAGLSKDPLHLDTLQELVHSSGTPIICIGSHSPAQDRTFQLISLPQETCSPGLERSDLMIVRFLCSLHHAEKAQILESLTEAYNCF